MVSILSERGSVLTAPKTPESAIPAKRKARVDSTPVRLGLLGVLLRVARDEPHAAVSRRRSAVQKKRQPPRPRDGCRMKREPAGKPNSVSLRSACHLSGAAVAGSLARPTCAACSTGRLIRPEAERRGLTLHPVAFARPPASPRAPVRSYRTLAPFTPMVPIGVGASKSGQDCSLLHVPSCRRSRQSSEQTIRHAFPLGSAVPCGVRTFLTAAPARIGTGPDQAGTTERWPDPHAT